VNSDAFASAPTISALLNGAENPCVGKALGMHDCPVHAYWALFRSPSLSSLDFWFADWAPSNCPIFGTTPLLINLSFGEKRLVESLLRIVGIKPLAERILEENFDGGGIISRLFCVSICIPGGKGESIL